MLVLDRDALICDLAQTYQIFDMQAVPLKLLATLASGLGMDSRIMLKRNGLKASWDTVLLAMLIDGWSNQKDKGLLSLFLEKKQKGEKSNSKIFNSAEEFEAARAEILGGHKNG